LMCLVFAIHFAWHQVKLLSTPSTALPVDLDLGH
jgi:hypothetical protein